MLAIAALFLVVLVIAVIVSLARLSVVSAKLNLLEGQIRSLAKRMNEIESTGGRDTVPGQASTRLFPPPGTQPTPVTPAEQGRPSPVSSLPPTKRAGPPSRTREEWEALIGGKLLNRIGALALILGVGFFLKYAFDNNWITETFRVLIGAALGVLCLVTAARSSRRGFHIFSQGLVGAGIAILYLSVYASFNAYSLVSQPVAFLLMAAVTVVAFVEAFRYDAISVSLLGLTGGFLTPFLLSSGESQMVGLLAYVALLDVGLIVVIARKDAWIALEPLAMLGTYGVYLTWHSAQYREEDLVPVLLFLTLFWVLFHLLDLTRLRRRTTSFFELRRGITILHSVVFYLCLQALLERESSEFLAGVSLSLGALYGVSALLADGDERQRPVVFGQFIITGILLLFIATLIEYRGFVRIVLWSAETLLVVWFGLKAGQKSVWRTAVFFLPFIGLGLLSVPGSLAFQPIHEFRLLVNERALAYVVLAASTGIVGYLYARRAPSASEKVTDLFCYGWLVLLFIVLAAEIRDLFRSWMIGSTDLSRAHLNFQFSMAIAAVWALAAWMLLRRGLFRNRRPLFYGSTVFFVAAVCIAALRGVLYDPIELLQPVFNIRAIVLLGVWALSLHVASMIGKASPRPEYPPSLPSILRSLSVIIVIILVSSETWDFFRQQIGTLTASAAGREHDVALERLFNLRQLSLSGIWLLLSVVLMAFGLWRRDRSLRIQSIALFGVAILKIFGYDLSFLATVYRIISFLALGVILLGVSYLYQKYRGLILESTPVESEAPVREGGG